MGIKLNLDDAWNKVKVPHNGKHAAKYHEWVISQLDWILEQVAYGDEEVFKKMVEEHLVQEIKEDFIILYKAGHE